MLAGSFDYGDQARVDFFGSKTLCADARKVEIELVLTRLGAGHEAPDERAGVKVADRREMHYYL